MAARDEGHRLLVVHRHARENLADIAIVLPFLTRSMVFMNGIACLYLGVQMDVLNSPS
jgi:hypothetical protein